jgi:hypothetical protein
MINLAIALLALFCTDSSNYQLPSVALVGSWKLAEVVFEKDGFTITSPVPKSYHVLLNLQADGTCTFTEKGSLQKSEWKLAGDKLIVSQAGQQIAELNIDLQQDNASWSYLATRLDLTSKDPSPQDRQLMDFAYTVALANQRSLEGVPYLNVHFKMIKQENDK